MTATKKEVAFAVNDAQVVSDTKIEEAQRTDTTATTKATSATSAPTEA